MTIWLAMAVLAAAVIYASVPLAHLTGWRRADTVRAPGRDVFTADARRPSRADN